MRFLKEVVEEEVRGPYLIKFQVTGQSVIYFSGLGVACKTWKNAAFVK